MKKSLIKKAEPDLVLSKEAAKFVAKARMHHEAVLRGVKAVAFEAFLTGVALNCLKECVEHGQFMLAVEKFARKITNGSAYRYMNLAKEWQPRFPMMGDLNPRLLLEGKPPKGAKEAIFKEFHDKTDGKGLTELYREIGVVRKPKPDGGFRPNGEMLEAWLRTNHPELAETPYDELPSEIQKAFKKQYRAPGMTPEEQAELHRDFWRDSAMQIGEELQAQTFQHLDAGERETIRMVFHDAAATLKGVTK